MTVIISGSFHVCTTAFWGPKSVIYMQNFTVFIALGRSSRSILDSSKDSTTSSTGSSFPYNQFLNFVGFDPSNFSLLATQEPRRCGIRPAQYRSVVSSTVMPLRWICEGNSRRSKRALQQPNLMRSLKVVKVGGFNPFGGGKNKRYIYIYTLPKTNSSHLTGGLPSLKRKLIFQPTPEFQVRAISFREVSLKTTYS